jgi:hypothetical protein
VTEADLAKKIITYLQGFQWEVFQEVTCYGGVADIVARQHGIVWIIETKTSLTWELLEQAHDRLHTAHYVSVGVPCLPKAGRHFASRVLRESGIGLITLGHSRHHIEVDGEDICEPIAPRLSRHVSTRVMIQWMKDLREKLCDKHNEYGVAGAAGSSRWTPFKKTCEEIRRYAARHPGCTMKELVDGIEHHYSSKSSARSVLPKWIQAGKVPGVRVEYEGGKFHVYTEKTDASPVHSG